LSQKLILCSENRHELTRMILSQSRIKNYNLIRAYILPTMLVPSALIPQN